MTTTTTEAVCPECEGAVTLPADPMVGEVLPCPSCGAELELAAIDPPALQPAPEVEEDWGE